MENRVSHNPLNGRFTIAGLRSQKGRDARRCCSAESGTGNSYEDAISQKDSNYWSVTENNSNNAWNVNFNSGNVNNNNKYNTNNVVRPVAAFGGLSIPFYESVLDAYRDCLRGKMTSPQAVQYMQIADRDLVNLAVELWTGTYKPGTSTCFLVKYPKLREVFAANFRDRVVHHWVCMRLNPLFEERFISQGNVSFNCRRGYGTDKAVRHVADGMCRVSDNYRKEAWVFRGDLVGFFMSIDKDLLWYRLERFILRWKKRLERDGFVRLCKVDLELLRLEQMPTMYWDILLRTTEIIVKHHPESDCILNSPAEWWHGLDKNKSLFTSPTGEPIGNLTTQLFANFLMSYFVTYVQFLFRRKNYCMAQFVDDFVIVCDDEKFILETIPKLEYFLTHTQRLKLHKDKRYFQPVSHGLLFVGTYIKPGRLYLSNRTRARFEERCNGFRSMMEKRDLNILDVKRMEQVINSYLGFCKGRQTYAFRREAIEGMGPEFWKYFYVKGHFESIRARKEYREIKLPL